ESHPVRFRWRVPRRLGSTGHPPSARCRRESHGRTLVAGRIALWRIRGRTRRDFDRVPVADPHLRGGGARHRPELRPAILYTARAWPRWHEPAGGTAAMRNRRFTRNSASRRRWLGAGPRRPGRESSTGGRVDLRDGLRLEHDPPRVSGRWRDDLGARAGEEGSGRLPFFLVRVGVIREA